MAFPVVQTKAGGGSAAATSHAITLPSGVTAGDLLVVWFGTRSTVTSSTSSTGWTKLGQSNTTNATLSIFIKVATGSDALTVDTSGSQRSTHESYRISGASGVVSISAGATGTSNPNTASLTPAGGAADYLWFSAATMTIGTITASAAPTNYTNLTNQPSGVSTGCAVSVAERQLNASSEDPGAFTAGSTTWVGYTLAVAPAGGGGTSYTLSADAGSYNLSGQTANLTSARSIVAAAGSYSLTGQVANLTSTRRILADPGSYSLTGQPATLTSARSIAADPGSYSLSGQPANLNLGRRLAADAGTYSLSGQDATFNIGRRLASDAGSYALTGNDAALTYTPSSTAYTITAAPGSYTLTGNPAVFPRLRRMIAAAGSYSLTGQAATLARGRRLTADPGSYALTGNAATFSRSIRLEAEAGSYVLTGQNADLIYIPTVGPQVVTFIIG